MSVYATAADVADGFRELDEDEQARASKLLEEAAVLIDATGTAAASEIKRVVSCRMVRRALGDGGNSMISMPLGSNQGSMAAGGYSQSWTIASGGAAGELYLGKTERQLLGLCDRLGAYNPLLQTVDGGGAG